MKTNLIIVLAAVAMLFTACKKDPEPELGNNQLIYNGVVYDLTSFYEPDTYMFYYGADAVTENETDVPKFSFFADGYYEALNTTFDLTQPIIGEMSAGYCIVLTWNDQSHPDFNANNGYGNMNGGLGDEDITDTPFKSGTITFTKDDTAFTVLIEGVLKNGDTIAMKLYVPLN